jgi:hypothetical protein
MSLMCGKAGNFDACWRLRWINKMFLGNIPPVWLCVLMWLAGSVCRKRASAERHKAGVLCVFVCVLWPDGTVR